MKLTKAVESSISKLRKEMRKTKAKNRYYKNKGVNVSELFTPITTKEVIQQSSSIKELKRYIKLLEIYNKRGSMKNKKSGAREWQSNQLKKVKQYAKYEDKKRESRQKSKQDKQGYHYLGDDTKKNKLKAQYNKVPKGQTAADYINKGFTRTTSKDYEKRSRIFKDNYLWSIMFNLGEFAKPLYDLIKNINPIEFYENIYLPYQSELDIDFIYSDEDARETAARIRAVIESVV